MSPIPASSGLKGHPSLPILFPSSKHPTSQVPPLATSYFPPPAAGHLGEGRESAEPQELLLSAEWEGLGLASSDLGLASTGEMAIGTQAPRGGTPSQASWRKS